MMLAFAGCTSTGSRSAGNSKEPDDGPLPSNGTLISIDVSKPGHAVPPTLWGISFEEINDAGEGGLYAELVQNRDFEANILPEGWRIDDNSVVTPKGWRTRLWFTNDLPAWSIVTGGNAEGDIAQESASPLNDRNPHSLRLTVTNPGERFGVANTGFWGMNVRAGEWYDLSFYARTESNAHFALTVSLENADGSQVCARATIPEVGGAWRKYTLPLHARESNPTARLVITMAEPGTIWFDVVSLFPRKAFKNPSDNSRAAARTSYQVQTLFAANRPDVVVPASVTTPRGTKEAWPLRALAGLDQTRNEVVLEVVNANPTNVLASVRIKGTSQPGARGQAITLSNAGSTADDALDDSQMVVPVETSFNMTGPTFHYDFPANSFTVLRLPARAH